jgi:hypothetical protein
MTRLEEIEECAWRHLVHEACRAVRENPDDPLMCAEAEGVLEYFEVHGVPGLEGERVKLEDTRGCGH